ncbi:MAG: right-handed parallel beta-helix repeat-containing protein [Desulfobulbaceae bacterium]|nr:right-handed parallel beta-helix repeat-containing protein [Desulfobulbaceae bacterium]
MKFSARNILFLLKPILCVLAPYALSLLAATTSSAIDYHVDATLGRDYNPGTEQAPWQSMAKVNGSRFQPGDKILFKRGESWHESLIIPASGVHGKHLLFGAYGEGSPPLIDCTTALNENRQQVEDEIYSFPWPRKPGVLFYRNLPKPSVMSLTFAPENNPPKGAILLQLQTNTPYTNLWVIGSDPQTGLVTGLSVFEEKWDTKRKVTIRRPDPRTGLEEQLPPMAPPLAVSHVLQSLLEPGHWYWAEGKIYLRDKKDPSAAQIRVSDLDYGINTKGHDYLTIENLAIRGAGTVGLFLLNSNHCRISGNHILGTGLLTHSTGILFMNASDNLVSGNRVEHSLGTGISVYAYDGLSHRNTVAANTVLDSGASGIMIGGEVGFRVQYTEVADNTVERANQIAYDSAGIYTYFCGSGNIIERNVIRGGGSKELKSSGIMIDIDSGPMIVRYNTIENNSHGGIVITEKGHFIHHNHLLNNAPPHWKSAEIVFFPVNDDVSDCEVTDNHLRTGPDMFLYRIAKGSNRGHFIDRNTYIGGPKNPFFLEERNLDFQQWQQSTGADAHSIHRRDKHP